MRTLHSQAHVVEGLPYDTYTTGANTGTTVDTAVYKNSFRNVLFIVIAELSGDAGTHTFTIQESDNDSDWVAVDAWRIQGTPPVVTTANDNAVHYFGVSPTLRYVRIVDTAASASTGLSASAVAVLTVAGSTPVARS